mmetsp:Transcript_1516/g.4567  ORF Transcript_1516/g.4567 Transcript_1516/m.4567 type:complete len:86 (-) Transcript_1516:52-309(-)
MGKKKEDVPTIDPATRHVVQTIQDDWENRELVEIVQMNVLTITQFLNKFDTSARYKLARINEKLSKLERALDYVEAAIKSTMEGE